MSSYDIDIEALAEKTWGILRGNDDELAPWADADVEEKGEIIAITALIVRETATTLMAQVCAEIAERIQEEVTRQQVKGAAKEEEPDTRTPQEKYPEFHALLGLTDEPGVEESKAVDEFLDDPTIGQPRQRPAPRPVEDVMVPVLADPWMEK